MNLPPVIFQKTPSSMPCLAPPSPSTNLQQQRALCLLKNTITITSGVSRHRFFIGQHVQQLGQSIMYTIAADREIFIFPSSADPEQD